MKDVHERVILVNTEDAELGSAEKLEVHRSASLHRAFSVFVLNSRQEMLLQRRAEEKYHTGGLWSNTCCGHPRPGESTEAAARRRLREEMGFDCALERIFGFVYRAELGGGLTEHEYDHVFVGWYDGDPEPDPREVGAWRWERPAAVCREMERDPAEFTPWFRSALEGLLRHRRAAADASPASAAEGN